MGAGVRLPKEYGGVRSDRHRHVSKVKFEFPNVTFREYRPHEDNYLLGPIFLDFQKLVNLRDMSVLRTYTHDGKTFRISDAEICLAHLDKAGAKFHMALKNDQCIGMVFYHRVADCILFVRGLFVYPEHEKLGLGSQLIDEIPKPVNRIIFQTNTHKPPERLFQITRDHNPIKVGETRDAITWEMEWKNGYF